MSTTKDEYNVSLTAEADEISCSLQSLMLPCRDGTKLHTVIYFPTNMRKKMPVLLLRTPYCRKDWLERPDGWALKNSIVYILQSCRGTAWSEGVFDPSERDQEKDDVEDLFRWLRTQTWFNGRCVTAGGSYPGWTQWCAERAECPGLVGTAPRVAPLYSCSGAAFPGGGVRLSFALKWGLSMHHRCAFGYSNVPDYEKNGVLWQLPVLEADRHAGYGELPPVRKFLAKALKPGGLLKLPVSEFKRFRAPAYIIGGWFDIFKAETVASFQLMRKYAATSCARGFTRLTIGPWGHGGLLNPDLFGKECNYEDLGVEKRRLQHLLGLLKNPHQDPLPSEPQVRYYSLGENRWHTSEAWPPPGTRQCRYYLHSGGNANSLSGDGTLSRRKCGDEPSDVYVSNPEDPVPSNDGTDTSLGCYDRTPQQRRPDVLVYTSPVFKRKLALAGEIVLRFSASVSTADTDFFAVLSDVLPDGRSMYLTMGMIRARFRNSLDRAELLEPGRLYAFEIHLSDIAVTFMPGHAMRLEIAGQSFPLCDRNPNTGGKILHDTELRKSIHTIHHSATHPAELLLPTLP
ncbi:MAG: CocE/NonD family hydrolase [Victivallales bacterium]|nr:CocE/NonD family hydrolase [Victivallales bacterium]